MITREQLLTVDVEKLADMLLTLYANNKDMHKQMDLLFAGLHEDDTELVAAIKKELSSLKRSSSYVDYYESDGLADRVDELRRSISVDLQKKSPAKAMEMMLKLLDESKHTLERADDSNGAIQSVFIQACDDVSEISKSVSKPVEEFVDIVFTQFVNDEYMLCDGIILLFKDVLQENGLRLLQARFENRDHDNSTTQRGLKHIADCFNDVDAYIKVYSLKDKIYIKDYLDIAKRLIQHGRAQEALTYLEIAMQDNKSHLWHDDVLKLKIEALELKGDSLIAQIERLSWFARDLNVKIYDQILQHMQSDLHDDFIKTATQQAFVFYRFDLPIDFFMHIKNLQELANFIFVRFENVNGDDYSRLRPAADALRDSYPLAATLLYRKMAQPVLEQAKSKYYDYAAKDLIACQLLSSQIIDWQSYDNHEIYFQHIEERHKRKPRFWETYKSALQKQAAKEAKLLARKK